MTTSLQARRKNEELRSIKKALGKEVHALLERTHDMERQKNALQNDPVYIERYLRQQHRLLCPGEKLLKEE